MRTKSILLSAAVLAAGVASSMASAVYSVNVVGYINVPLAGNATKNNNTGQYNLIANPLDASNGGANPSGNTLASLFPSPQNFDEFLQWNGTNNFNIATYLFGSWTTNLTVTPGTGGFYFTGVPQTNTFVGTVLQGTLTNTFKSGYQVIGNMIPVASTADTNGLATGLAFGDSLLQWDNTLNGGNGGYDIYTWFGSFWNPSAPLINPGQAVFMNTASGESWVETFNVQ
jgi:hypothetical protein